MTMMTQGSLELLRGKFKGQRVWIVGSGPSVDDVDLKRLRGEHIIALNASIVLFANSALYPNTHWLYRDLRAFRETFPKLVEAKWRCWKLITHDRGFYCMKDTNIWKRHSVAAHLYALSGLVHQRTISEDALQIANYLEFAEAYLLGVDCAVRDGRYYCKALDGWKESHCWNKAKPVPEPKFAKAMGDALEALKPKLTLKVFNVSSFARPIFEYRDFNDLFPAKSLAAK